VKIPTDELWNNVSISVRLHYGNGTVGPVPMYNRTMTRSRSEEHPGSDVAQKRTETRNRAGVCDGNITRCDPR